MVKTQESYPQSSKENSVGQKDLGLNPEHQLAISQRPSDLSAHGFLSVTEIF